MQQYSRDGFPARRPRRLRSTPTLRRMLRETTLELRNLIQPLFVTHETGASREIPSLPGNYHWPVEHVGAEAEALYNLGIPAVLLFGLPPAKDAVGSGAYASDGVVQRAVRAIKVAVPDLIVMTDVCLCEYTDHGHCGVVEGHRILNDPSLELIARTAVSHAAAGADVVAPSDMMDGRIAAVRSELDSGGFQDTVILSYAAKYASAFYGPFRDAAGSAPQFGDRRSYQMDPPNRLEALKEVLEDISEGADMVMVKPALAYLDVIREVCDAVLVPVAAYNVSGEFAMVKAAAARGWLDEERAIEEVLTSIRRAGADLILTYHAREFAERVRRVQG